MLDEINVKAHSKSELFVLLAGRSGFTAAKTTWSELTAILIAVVLLYDLLPIDNTLLVWI